MSETVYSEQCPGTKGNFNWPIRCDYQDGFIGITQTHRDSIMETLCDRVLLSPQQWRSLLAFMNRSEAQRAKMRRAKKKAR